MEQRHIKIMGAGISGLAAAINLRRAGCDVTVYEKNSDCGMRYHNDFQGIENWTGSIDALEELKGYGIEINFRHKPFTEMYLAGDDLKKYHVRSIKPNYYLVKRGTLNDSLDQSVKNQALREGVEIVFNRSVDESDVDIIASGSSGADAVGQGIAFNTDSGDIAITLLDNSVAPGGYAYMFIVDGQGLIMTWYFKKFSGAKGILDLAIKKFDDMHRFSKTNVKKIAGSVNFFVPHNYVRNDKLLVGESAGLQDFFASFGMKASIKSGYLAARSIIENKDYDTLMKQEFKDFLNIGIANRFIWERMSNSSYKRLIKKASNMNDTNIFLKNLYAMKWYKYPLVALAKARLGGKSNYTNKLAWSRARAQEL